MKKLYIGIDIGTSSIKLKVVDHKLILVYQHEYPYRYNTFFDDWKEIHPGCWYDTIIKGLKRIFDQIPPQDISGIGITGQMHTTVFLDKEGKSVRPAIMWNDMRTKEMIPVIKEQLKKNEKTAHLAKIVSTGSPLANLIWVKQIEAEHFQRIHKVLTPVSYIVYRLTDQYVTDYCDASVSSLYNLYDNVWSKEIQNIFQFSPCFLPGIEASSKIIGQLSVNIKKELGISNEIKVVVGTGDNAASAIANQIFADNQPLISLGTSGVLMVPNQNSELKQIGKNVMIKIRVHDTTMMTQGAIQAGAKLNTWWMDKIIHANDCDIKQNEISKKLLGENKTIFLPHLDGEKTLYASPGLRGAFIGLGLETTQAEMYLAILEGAAFAIRALFESMKNKEEPKYFSMIGGGAKSALWVEIFANILGYPIKKYLSSREAADGAAMLAIIGDGESIEHNDVQNQMIYPDETLIHKYNQQYKKYSKLTKLTLDLTNEA